MPSRAVSALPFILALATAPAFAAPQDCAPIENDLDRLACYDREAGRTPAVATVPNASAWKVRLETSEMTDTPTFFSPCNPRKRCRAPGPPKR